tara:strand:+ start:97 stop:2577 length:2481 start_codon:yes stop_codon:yes gene_type:complete
MRRPLFHAAAWYCGGVVLGEFQPAAPLLLLTFAAATGLAVLAFIWINHVADVAAMQRANLYAHPARLAALFSARLRPILMALFLVLAGWTNHALHTSVLWPNDLRMLAGDTPRDATLRGRLANTPEQRGNRWLARIDAAALAENGEWQSASGRVLATFSKPPDRGFYRGRHVEVDGVLTRPPPAAAPGLLDQRRLLALRGIHYELRTDRFTQWNLLDTPHPPRPLSDHFRTWAMTNLARSLPERDEALELLWAMSLGWRTALTGEVKMPFMQSGTMHLFAISGLHIGMVAAILVGLLRVLRVRRGRVAWIAIPMLWFYAAATGWQPSAVRATIMMTLIIAGWSLNRPVDLLNSIGAAALLILAWDPRQLFQASFQLSFTVVLALALVLPPLIDRLRPWISTDPLLPRALWPRWRRAAMWLAFWGINALAVSLVAWLASAPIIAYYFHLFTPSALLANVPVVTCGMFALMSCLGSLFTGALLPFVSELFNHSAWFFMRCMMITSEWAASLPGAFEFVRAPSGWFMGVYYAIFFGLGSGFLFREKIRRWTCVVLTLLALFGWQALLTDREAARLTLIPNTPAVFQESFRGGPNLLIDTGPAGSINFTVLPVLRSRGVDALDNVTMTHGTKHQIGGFTNLFQKLPPNAVFRSHAKTHSPYSKAATSWLEQRSNVARIVSAGDHVGDWKVLHPPRDEDHRRSIDDALVLRATFNNVRVLLLADLGELGQESLVHRIDNLTADLVITSFPNFGEPLQPWLLDAIQPKVILVHDSQFPVDERTTKSFRTRMSRAGAEVFYTTRKGGMRVEIKPGKWRIIDAAGRTLWLDGRR